MSANRSVEAISYDFDWWESYLNWVKLRYKGIILETVLGYICQKWSFQVPHKHEIGVNDEDFPDRDVESANNYCRNPNADGLGPWCYTSSIFRTWDYCYIPGVTTVLNRTVLYAISQALVIYMYPVLILFGTFLNSLSVRVFTRPAFKRSTTALLLIALAVTDTLSLYIGAGYRWLTAVASLLMSDLSCKICFYIIRVTSSCPGWILVCVAV